LWVVGRKEGWGPLQKALQKEDFPQLKKTTMRGNWGGAYDAREEGIGKREIQGGESPDIPLLTNTVLSSNHSGGGGEASKKK